MDPREVYKKLPRKDCGKCSAGTCMAFAVQYLRRQIRLSECCELDNAGRSYLENMFLSKPPEDGEAKS
jgi:ArsR family metal-binding transcriptional regulator